MKIEVIHEGQKAEILGSLYDVSIVVTSKQNKITFTLNSIIPDSVGMEAYVRKIEQFSADMSTSGIELPDNEINAFITKELAQRGLATVKSKIIEPIRRSSSCFSDLFDTAPMEQEEQTSAKKYSGSSGPGFCMR